MKVELPIIVQSQSSKEAGRLFQVQPLFLATIRAQDRDLQYAVQKLVRKLQKTLRSLSRCGDHEGVARSVFSPDVELRKLAFRIELRNLKARVNLPVATFQQRGQWIAFSPYLPDLWFEVVPLEKLKEAATNVYAEYFRTIEKNDGLAVAQKLIKRFESIGRIRLEYAEFNINTSQSVDTGTETMFAIADAGEKVDGRTELERVGRCLDHAYPNQLKRYMCDGRPLETLCRAFQSMQRRPVMLVGSPLVGKTSLIHEWVYQRVAARPTPYSQNGNAWLISPQRLISGMKYVGQWENRLLAIIKVAKKSSHILYFDDMLGLHQAGKTCSSDLSAADVLKPYVERADVQVLAEITPESLRVFRERDRGFADLFDLIHLEQPGDERLVPILLSAIRNLERDHKCRFDLDVLPTVLELTRRYRKENAYPGKAVVLLEHLALKSPGTDIDRKRVLSEFRTVSGLDLMFLDRDQQLKRSDVINFLESQVLGQAPAIEAMADIITVAKAGLNDPHKPLGSLFFLGPTGVGKTECAKALARFLFGDEGRLLRFDMNEFVSPEAVARLVGTFDQPEGLMTGAVRQQPFGILLLDEVEKAHPDVFDLLLQVLGEARLSDALGRTISFANMIVILTSNLGTRDAEHEVGFAGEERGKEAIYQRAIRQYFRPEFVNRLDRIVPFGELRRGELRTIAERTLENVLAREGFGRRQCALDLRGDTLDAVVEKGHHPKLGARAMRRAIEDHIVLPIGEKLSEIPTDRPTLVTLGRRQGTLTTEVTEFSESDCIAEEIPAERFQDVEGTIDRAMRVLARIGRDCEEHRPQGELGVATLESNVLRYFEMTEHVRVLRAKLDGLREQADGRRASQLLPVFACFRFLRKGKQIERSGSRRSFMKEMTASLDIHEYFKELCDEAARQAASDPIKVQITEVCRAIALLDMLRPEAGGWPTQRALVLVRTLAGSTEIRKHLVKDLCVRCQLHRATVGSDFVELGLDFDHWVSDGEGNQSYRSWWDALPDGLLPGDWRTQLHLDVITFEGHKAADLLKQAEGTHLFYDDMARLKPAQVAVVPVLENEEYATAFSASLAAHQEVAGSMGTHSQSSPDPFAWRDVVSVFSKKSGSTGYRWMLDFRSGMQATNDTASSHNVPLWTVLPLPGELKDEPR